MFNITTYTEKRGIRPWQIKFNCIYHRHKILMYLWLWVNGGPPGRALLPNIFYSDYRIYLPFTTDLMYSLAMMTSEELKIIVSDRRIPWPNEGITAT